MSRFIKILSSATILVVSGCASLPNGPGVMVLPGSGMSFDRFRNDDIVCQQFASFQVGGTTANQAAVKSGVTSAAVGTALGAATGAAIGGGQGAAVGAGAGLVGGGLVGSSAANSSMYDVQQRYDIAYIQCMYAKGHQVPVSGQFSGVIPQHTPVEHMPPPTGSASPSHIPPPPAGPPPLPPQ
jgi:hypothetical protein